MKNNLSINTVISRDISLKSKKVEPSFRSNYQYAKRSIRENTINYNEISTYFKDNINFKSANNNAIYCLDILKLLSESSIVDRDKYNFLLKEYIEYILPFVEDLRSISENSNINNIRDGYLILEAINDLKESDRIIYNFNKICEKSNIDIIQDISNRINNNIDLETVVENIYNLLDYNFKLKNGPKLNLVLETALFAFNKLGYNFNTKDLVNEATNIIMSRSFSEADLKSYRNVLENNILLEKSDIEDVQYVFESEEFADSNDVEKLITAYKKQSKKDDGALKNLIKKIYAKSPENIIDETPNILAVIRKFGVFGTLAIHPVITIVAFCVDKFIDLNINQKETNRIIKYFKREKERVKKKINNTNNEEQKNRLESYGKSLDAAIDKLEMYSEDIKTDFKDEEDDDYIEESSKYTIDKYTLDEYEKEKYGETIKELKIVVAHLSNILFLDNLSVKRLDEYIEEFQNSSKIYRFVTPSGFIQIPIFYIETYSDFSKDEKSKLYKYISDLCYRTSEQFDGYRVLVKVIERGFLLLFMSISSIDIRYMDKDSSDKFDMSSIKEISELLYSMEVINNTKTNPDMIINRISESIYKKSPDEYDITLFTIGEQLLEFTNNTNILETFKEAVTYRKKLSTTDEDLFAFCKIEDNIRYIDISENCINSIDDINDLNEYNNMVNFLLELELPSIGGNKNNKNSNNKEINTKEDVKNKVKEKKEIKDNKNKQKATLKDNINKGKLKVSKTVDNIKNKVYTNVDKLINTSSLAMEGLKKDIQNLSDKEKQASKDLDAGFNSLKKGIEKALVSDSKESIIRGSIIPSFSKMIKTGILFGGTFVFLNPVVAVIGAIGAFAVSKSLTNKERQLILDEIEVELDLVEKELSNAEDEKDMKRYRQLLQYQRKLEREYQRINYNIKVFSKEVAPVIKK